MSDSPFTDEMVRHYIKVVQTQHGILEAIEAIAKVMVEMGRASQKAVGDSPVVAIYKWTDLLRKRACELARENPPEPTPMQRKLEDLQCELPKPRKKLPSPNI